MSDQSELMHNTLLPMGYLEAIGRVTLNFAILEEKLLDMIHSMIGREVQVTAIIVAGKGFRDIVSLARNLFVYYANDYSNTSGTDKSESIKSLNGYLKRANDIAEERNLITHSMWWVDKETGEVGRVKVSRSSPPNTISRDYTLEGLNEFADSIARLSTEIWLFNMSEFGRDLTLADVGDEALEQDL
jgi:hypothetical protein